MAIIYIAHAIFAISKTVLFLPDSIGKRHIYYYYKRYYWDCAISIRAS